MLRHVCRVMLIYCILQLDCLSLRLYTLARKLQGAQQIPNQNRQHQQKNYLNCQSAATLLEENLGSNYEQLKKQKLKLILSGKSCNCKNNGNGLF